MALPDITGLLVKEGEAVANAIIHRDYGVRGTDFMISVFDDRLEICNPGGLTAGLGAGDLGKISKRRNELIADLFHRMRKVERMGTGIRRMVSGMVTAGLPKPRFEYDAFFIITLRRSLKAAAAFTGRSPKSSVKIIGMLQRNPGITIPEIAAELGLTTRAVKKNIASMKAAGAIKRIGPAKGGHWEVVEL